MSILREFQLEQIRNTERPHLRSGDIVRVSTKVTEGDKTRVQVFEGTVIGIRGSGPSATFTVRRETGKYGVERIFPVYSPLITVIDIVKRQKVRRAKLNYLRQEGRRRVREDETAMQRYVQEEENKQRLADAAAEAATKEAETKQKEETAVAPENVEGKASETDEAAVENKATPEPDTSDETDK